MRKFVLEESSLCPGFEFYDIQPGVLSKEEILLRRAGGSDGLTWLTRLGAFMILWVGLCLIAGPGGAVPLASVMPGIAESETKVDDCVAISCISFIPGIAIFFGVVGVVWVNERPKVGIICIGMMFVVVILSAIGVLQARARKGAIMRAARWRDSQGGFNAGARWDDVGDLPQEGGDEGEDGQGWYWEEGAHEEGHDKHRASASGLP